MPLLPTAYSPEPEDQEAFQERFNRFYGRYARFYDRLVKRLPAWRRWIESALPHVRGPRVLEISFGTGHLLPLLSARFETWGADLNEPLARIARGNLGRSEASLQLADVTALPYRNRAFDSLVCTMAFSGYPDSRAALAEMVRVLRPGGRLVLVDVNYPEDGRFWGVLATRLWMGFGDLIRDLDGLMAAFGLDYRRQEVGGLGSVHLYVAQKPEPAEAD